MAPIPVGLLGLKEVDDAQSNEGRGSILSVDKSGLPFVKQLDEVCEILGTDFSRFTYDYDYVRLANYFENYCLEESRKSDVVNGPRYEWAFKWILNKLSGDIERDSPCLELRTWLLIRYLMFKIDAPRVAQILTGEKFLSAVRRTLAWLRGKVRGHQPPPYHVRFVDDQDDTETMSNGSKEDDNKSKASGAKAISFEAMSMLIFAIHLIFDTTRLLMRTEARSTVEYLKIALKCTPEEAANIVGDAFFLLDVICRNTSCLVWMGFSSYVYVTIEFWDSRFSTVSDVDNSRFESFMRTGLLPTLLLVDTFQNSVSACPDGASCRNLKDFVIANAIKPLQRSSKLKLHEIFQDFDKIISEQMRSSPALDPPTIGEVLPSSRKGRRQTHDKVTLIIELGRSFFELAITCTPRDSPKSRKEGQRFLQTFFDDLRISLAAQFGPEASRSRPVLYSGALKGLLNQAVESNVQLTVTTIQSILREESHLLDENETKQVEWEIVSLCLRNNSDAFLNPKTAASGPKSQRKAEEVLRKLFSALRTPEDSDVPSSSDELYRLKLNGVLLPLIHAFAKMRNLFGFLEHWQTKLADTTSGKIWADDIVLSTVQKAVEPSLSVEQFKTTLEKIDSNLKELEQTVESQPKWSRPRKDRFKAMDTSDLVLLDCLLGTHCSENLQGKVADRVRSIHSTLTDLFLKSPDIFGSQSWRVWRILTSIHQNWLNNDSTSSIPSACWQLAVKASLIIDAVSDAVSHETARDGLFSYRERSIAFNFMASLYSSDQVSHQAPPNIRDKFDKSVNWILKLHNLEAESTPGSILHDPEPSVNEDWNGRSDTVESYHQLYLSCISRLLAQYSALTYVKTETLKNMLAQLSLLACREKDSAKSSEPALTYSWLWNYAQHCEAVFEQKTYSEILRHRQCEICMAFLDPRQKLYGGFSDGKKVLALSNVLGAPIDQFNEDDTVTVWNGIFEALQKRVTFRWGIVVRHFEILAKFASISRTTCERMKIFENSRLDRDDPGERSAVFLLAELVSSHYRPKFDTSHTEESICTEALCGLTRIILKYVYDTLATESSARYFTMFYQWIGSEMDRESTDTPVCQTNWSSDTPMRLVTVTALNFYHENRRQVYKVLGPNDNVIDNIRQRHFERVFEICFEMNIRRMAEESNNNFSIIAMNLKCLYGYMDLLLADPRMLQKAVNNAGVRRRALAVRDTKCYEEARALFYQISYKIPIFRNPDAITSQLMPGYSKTNSELQLFEQPDTEEMRHREQILFQSHVPNLDCEAIEKLLATMPLNFQMHLLLGLTNTQKAGLQRCIAQRYLSLCSEIQTMTVWKDLVGATRFLNILLRKCPEHISQHLIETTLSTLTTTATNLNTHQLLPHNSPSSNKGPAFTCLTRLLSTLLTHHRPKLGGRYHLTLPPLQSLLHLLFTPYARSPPTDHPLTATHAAQYARLLTTLSDPSPSAVARPRQHRSGTALNDETKRARNVAGQHLHYLIITYCECRLGGRFAAEGMKEALEPGLWAVLGCVGEDVTRAMSAGMEDGCRAIWKRLYEDWRRIGGGQGRGTV